MINETKQSPIGAPFYYYWVLCIGYMLFFYAVTTREIYWENVIWLAIAVLAFLDFFNYIRVWGNKHSISFESHSPICLYQTGNNKTYITIQSVARLVPWLLLVKITDNMSHKKSEWYISRYQVSPDAWHFLLIQSK